MELKLNINGEERLFESGKITMRLFRKASRIHRQFVKEELFGENYPESDFDKAISFIVEYFGNQFTVDEFWDGYELADSTDFFGFFLRVLNNIQTNEEKQEFFEKIQELQKASDEVTEEGQTAPPSVANS